MRVKISATALLLAALVLAGAVPASAQRARGATRQAAAAKAVYSCPMHPSVVSAKPGVCPKCNMKLRRADETQPAEAETPAGTKPDAPAASVGMSIPDVELLDQDGRRVRFYTDLVRGRVVVINFIFTTCTTVCPPLGATFARVQKELGERAGRDVHLISVSVDPVTDTPERMKAWGEKFKAGPGWTFVTGGKPEVEELLRALGASTARREDHTPTVLVGNDPRGQWTRAYGLSSPSRLVQLVNDAAEGRLEAQTQTKESN